MVILGVGITFKGGKASGQLRYSILHNHVTILKKKAEERTGYIAQVGCNSAGSIVL